MALRAGHGNPRQSDEEPKIVGRPEFTCKFKSNNNKHICNCTYISSSECKEVPVASCPQKQAYWNIYLSNLDERCAYCLHSSTILFRGDCGESKKWSNYCYKPAELSFGQCSKFMSAIYVLLVHLFDLGNSEDYVHNESAVLLLGSILDVWILLSHFFLHDHSHSFIGVVFWIIASGVLSFVGSTLLFFMIRTMMEALSNSNNDFHRIALDQREKEIDFLHWSVLALYFVSLVSVIIYVGKDVLIK